MNGLVFFSLLVLFMIVEFFGHVLERGAGYYLKWHNHQRAQLGRLWEQDRQKLVAQKKVQTILSSQNLQDASSQSIHSLKELFESLSPAFPLLISREKFLDLYFDFPDHWAHQIISPFDLIRIDSDKAWRRVLLTRFSGWVTLSFIDSQNFPIQEIFLAQDRVQALDAIRTVERGTLEDSGFSPESIYPIADFLEVFQTLDSATQEAVFPNPQWFLSKQYHVTRVGVTTEDAGMNQPVFLGIEYQSDFFTHVLILPVPEEVANNMLSLIERSPQETTAGPLPPQEKDAGASLDSQSG
ncbi:MAG: hypothetical protein ACE5ER_05730 [Nitrospinaceae bacterium]